MGGIELVAGFSGLGSVVFDALRLVENNPVEFRLPRVQKRKFCCVGSIIKVDVAACIVLHKLI